MRLPEEGEVLRPEEHAAVQAHEREPLGIAPLPARRPERAQPVPKTGDPGHGSLRRPLAALCLVVARRRAAVRGTASAMISCMHTSKDYHGGDSVAYTRDLNTLVWFTLGTLRELAHGIQHLRSALARCGRLDPESAP